MAVDNEALKREEEKLGTDKKKVSEFKAFFTFLNLLYWFYVIFLFCMITFGDERHKLLEEIFVNPDCGLYLFLHFGLLIC